MSGIFTKGGRPGFGHAAIDPAISAGTVAAAHAAMSVNGEKPNPIDAGAAIEHIAARVKDGDMSDLEAILVGQAVSLNVAGFDMLARARKSGTTDAINTLAAAGMRAIAHSRAAIDSLANLKNPRSATFVKQTNVAHGAQQINNNTGDAPASRTPAHEAVVPTELLLEANASPTLERGTARRAGRRDSTLEAVEVRNRTSKRGGQGNVRA
ncbi:MAG: hypothetical protein EOO27_03145 [Comamonadaceae bacterium]|nr:MAG: hypothetical protein EOO27_03145 [Comamonadaceae bacterium]